MKLLQSPIVQTDLGRVAFTMMLALTSLLIATAVASAPTSDVKKPTQARTDEPSKHPPLAEPQRDGTLAAQYCNSVRDAVAEARLAYQSAKIDGLSARIEERITQLDARLAELRQWQAKRDAFADKATAHLVGIYAAMRPEAASEQLVRLDMATAAAIISKLDTRAASTILNDMPPEKAARLAGILADAARKTDQVAKR